MSVPPQWIDLFTPERIDTILVGLAALLLAYVCAKRWLLPERIIGVSDAELERRRLEECRRAYELNKNTRWGD